MTWAPLSLPEVTAAFADAPYRWWISGGMALELHVGRTWRQHEDTDIGIVRQDAPAVFECLDGWAMAVAAAGQLSRWDGRPLLEARSENNVWARRRGRSSWELDLTIGSGTEKRWIYRRDPSIRRPWPAAVLLSDEGVPYLAPDLQLLFKSKNPRPKDDEDARVVIPALDDGQQRFLVGALPAHHPWQELLTARL